MELLKINGFYSTGDGSNPYAVAAVDLNNDNQLDLVIANEGSDSISVLLGFDYTSFQQQKHLLRTPIIQG